MQRNDPNTPCVVFGEDGLSHAIHGARVAAGPGKWALGIYRMRNATGYERGDPVDPADMGELESILYFARPESVSTMIRVLEEIRDAWAREAGR